MKRQCTTYNKRCKKKMKTFQINTYQGSHFVGMIEADSLEKAQAEILLQEGLVVREIEED